MQTNSGEEATSPAAALQGIFFLTVFCKKCMLTGRRNVAKAVRIICNSSRMMYIFILPSTNLTTVIHTESEFIQNLRVESSKPCLIHIGVERTRCFHSFPAPPYSHPRSLHRERINSRAGPPDPRPAYSEHIKNFKTMAEEHHTKCQAF